ncbi:MAG: outer membrane protein assembly factor BamD [Gammaproteobacteria bacterium]|nr:outer membrane protein assembly factor BamD [Gammaproteobacteria bacterium]MCF6364319.1 outer membrane protein assembly factor BamD [Gammaproteobacteria bacterium]
MALNIIINTPLRLLPALLLATLLLGGCASTLDDSSKWSAELLYSEAKAALRSSDYESAIKHFETLEAKYPFGKYAEQAQLDTAYAYYKFEEPDSAIAAADRFIKLHPRHPSVDYAYYLRGLASASKKDNPLDFAVTIDSSLLDPSSARQSFNYFNQLVQRFPDSRYVQDAIRHMKILREHLAEHEIHVARYYLKRHAYVAAANRATFVLETYPRSPTIPSALDILITAYEALDLQDLATDARRVKELNFPSARETTQSSIGFGL